MHRVVSLATDNLLRTLFPTVEMLPATQTALPQIRCYNQLIERNEKQLMAVKHIVMGAPGPSLRGVWAHRDREDR